MSKKKTISKQKKVPAKAGTTVLYKIPKSYKSNKKLESKSVKTYLDKKLKGTTKEYKKKVVRYMNVYTKTNNDLKTAIQKTENDTNNNWKVRLKYIRKDKRTGKKIWHDIKTGKNIKGEAVRKIVWKSIQTKTIENLAKEKNITFDKAKKQYVNKMERKYIQLKKQKQFKDKIKQWKKEGFTKIQIAERGEKLLEGRAELRTIRSINQSYYYG